MRQRCVATASWRQSHVHPSGSGSHGAAAAPLARREQPPAVNWPRPQPFQCSNCCHACSKQICDLFGSVSAPCERAGATTSASMPNSRWKMPKVPGPHTSCVSSLSTSVQMLSPGRTCPLPECRARIFSVIVIGCFTCATAAHALRVSLRCAASSSNFAEAVAVLPRPQVDPPHNKRQRLPALRCICTLCRVSCTHRACASWAAGGRRL